MRLAKHAIKCSKTPEDIHNIISNSLRNLPFQENSEESKKIDKQNLQFVRILASSNCPFTSLDNQGFRKFMRDYASDVKLVSRKIMSSKYLPYEANQQTIEMHKIIETGEDYSVSIEFDHLRDVSHRLILAIIATIQNGARIMLALDDVTLIGKKAEDIVVPLRCKLEWIPKRKLNSIISDSASSCKLAREQLCLSSEYKHIIQHRCMAHFLNSIGDHLSNQDVIKQMVETATKLASFINNHDKIFAKLKQASHNRVPKATETRWYSLVNMLESLYKVKNDAELILRDSDDGDAKEMHEELVFLNEMTNAIRIFRPLANCIAIAEKADGSIGETTKAVLKFAKSLFGLNWGNRTVSAGIKSFLTYFCPKKLGDELHLMLAAYCLDRANKMDYMTKTAI